jgi:polynucleotide 5'-kinase involved in rRNA processing
VFLFRMAAEFKQELEPPRAKITVMLLGNHSSGKSSFVNWYIGSTENPGT